MQEITEIKRSFVLDIASKDAIELNLGEIFSTSIKLIPIFHIVNYENGLAILVFDTEYGKYFIKCSDFENQTKINLADLIHK